MQIKREKVVPPPVVIRGVLNLKHGIWEYSNHLIFVSIDGVKKNKDGSTYNYSGMLVYDTNSNSFQTLYNENWEEYSFVQVTDQITLIP